ncbi:copper resistance D family protein [Halobacillus sp. B23F22_1]|uniref:copper resistance D family protein n=1 Tax=Halobacillus sp. B23F22_1 TaxID=3459514 RepID=UPI00373F1B30
MIIIGALLPILSLFPIIALTLNIHMYQEESYLSSFFYVLKELETGRAWVTLTFFSLLYIGVIATVKSRPAAFTTSLFLVLGMILTQGVVGHAANMSSYPGALAHIVHLLAICSWAGILLVVSWFSKNEKNWDAFVEWYTFIAIGCVVMLTFTGLFMSFSLTESIVQSWILPYGQALLLKQLLFLALLLFAFINGFLIRKKVETSPSFSPKKWWRAESIIILTIFSLTGFMSEKEPPHNIEQALNREETSILFQTFMSVNIGEELSLSPSIIGLFFMVLAGLFFLFTYLLFSRQESAAGALIMSGIAVISLYIGLMNSVESAGRTPVLESSLSSLGHVIKIVA